MNCHARLTANVISAARKVVAAWFAQEEDDDKIEVDKSIVELSTMLNDFILYECSEERIRAVLLEYGEDVRIARETSNERNKKAAEKPKGRKK